jgi:hypothetical protein
VATVEQRSAPAPAETSAPGAREPVSEASPLIGALIVAAALLAVSTMILVWAKTRPGFDPYGWLVWGRQTVAGSLNTNAAPSWKPLPYLFTVPYGLFGHYQLWLWMITALAVSLSGSVFAGRIAYRLTAAPDDRLYAAYAAAAFAGLALLGISDYWHYMLSAQSDPMIVALCLAAIDCHLSGRPRWAFVLGALAGLGRPEVWLFLGLYAIWAWFRVPSMRWLIVAGTVAMLLLWFGIPALTSHSAFVAASNALGSGRRLRSDRVFGTIHRFLDLNPTVVELTALLSVALAAWRRDRATLVLAAGVCAWVLIEIAFSLHGWPGLGRYMFEPAGVLIAIAGVGVGRLLADPPRMPATAMWAGAAVVAVIVIALVPPAVTRARNEHRDIRVQRVRTTEINRLSGTIARLGGASRFTRCGEPLTRLEYQTILAWMLHVNVARVGYKYGPAIASRRPIVLFTPLPHGGWLVQALHQRLPECRSLPS